MEPNKVIARHVFHTSTSGLDRMHAWQEMTGEPIFAWGRNSGQSDGFWFRSVKRDFQKWLAATESAQLTIYHDGMGADALGPLDPVKNKILYLHNWIPRWEKNFEWMLRCTGKVLVGHPEHVDSICRKFAWIPDKYILHMNQPKLPLEPVSEEGRGPKRRIGIWLHGRTWRKYGNRLRAIIDRWPKDSGEVEVVVSGNKVPAWAQKDHIIWSGDLPFHFALMRIHTWDSCLLLNDYSFDAPWLIRALELGCFPVVPEGSGVARTEKWQEDSAPQPYEWGDVEAAVKLLGQWREHRINLQDDFRKWAKEVVNHQEIEQLPKEWEVVKKKILQTRAPRLRPRKPVGNSYPVSWYERVQRLRSGT